MNLADYLMIMFFQSHRKLAGGNFVLAIVLLLICAAEKIDRLRV